MAEEAQAEADSLKDEIKAYMGASETLSVGEYKITYKTVKGSRLDGTALKKAMPDIYSAFCRPTETAVSAWRKEVYNMTAKEELKDLISKMNEEQFQQFLDEIQRVL